MREKPPGRTPGSRGEESVGTATLAAFATSNTRRKGQLIGKRYRIEGRLGSGSTADVYLSVDTTNNQPVVVKQLTDNATHNTELLSRFLSEAKALSRLSHQNIVRVLDFGAPTDERPFLVMEALLGETLATLLARKPLLSEALTRMIATNTARGLEYAHRAGVFHRDVKPDNLFLVGPLSAPTDVKVIDFGMAKIPKSNGSSGVHTVLGTVEYMAPEQVMADPVDGRTDIYGLGIMLFRLLTAHLPFEAPAGIDLLSHQLFSPIPPASWINDDVSPRLEQVVARATRKHPSNRYQSMTELLADLALPQSFIVDPSQQRRLVVDPDVYTPENPKGREVAELLAERYRTIAPSMYAHSDQVAALSLINFRSGPPGAFEPPLPNERKEEDG